MSDELLRLDQERTPIPQDPRTLPEMRPLTPKQTDFVLAYLGPAKGNATEAARQAGYAGSDNTLSTTGYENLRKPKIKRAMEAVLHAQAMGPETILAELSQIARATADDFYDITESGFPVPNLNKAIERGAIGAVKQLKFNENGLQIKLHDRISALWKLMQLWLQVQPADEAERSWRQMEELSERMGINLNMYFDNRSSVDN